MEFLGTLVDTVDMTLGITPERKTELMNELRTWTNKKCASKRQLQSLIGKLSFVTNCVKFGRVFLNRLIHALSMLPKWKKGRLPSDICNDIEWWKGLIPQYSGVSMLWLKDHTPLGSCWPLMPALMLGGGTCMGNQYIHFRFPQHIKTVTQHILQLELLTIVVALKTWSA